MLAKREHIKNLPLVYKKAIEGISASKINAIAVTVGPGLEPCLWQGINFAKELSKKWKKPLIPVNHIEAHILANLINGSSTPIKFPAVCLVVSGGHTQLILMNGIGKYKLLGETRDDAAGECFDKTARILGLGYPGGPVIARYATQWKPENQKTSKPETRLPRPMIYTKDYDLSFSGLKTAVLYKAQGKKHTKDFISAMCAEIQQSIIDVLIRKTLKVAKDFGAKTIILGGGVAANDELRRQLKLKTDFFVPPKNLCTDNGAMVALTAFFHRSDKKKIPLVADSNLRL